MFDLTTPKGRILAAALDCAAKKSWADVSLLDIAEAAQLPLGALRDIAASKGDILAGLVRAVDDEVLKRAPKRSDGQEPRDHLFDIIMTRFDVLGPHKAALKSIRGSGAATDSRLTRALLASQHWMLQAAGINTEGPAGALRVSGVAMVYASVFRTWLDDDDPGHARTMAALDRRLRRGERSLGSIEQVCSVVQRVASDAPAFLRSVLRGRAQPQPAPTPDTGTTAGTL